MTRRWGRLFLIVTAAGGLSSTLLFSVNLDRTSRVGWETFRQDYVNRYHRSPPDTLQQWLQYAQQKRCEPINFYDNIEQDLAPFRARNAPLTYRTVDELAKDLTEQYAIVTIANHKVTFEKYQIALWPPPGEEDYVLRFFEYNVRRLLQPLMDHHRPPLHTSFVITYTMSP